MRSTNPFQTSKDSAALISQYFRGNEHLFSEAISFDRIRVEARALNRMESMIPREMLLELHLDMILNRGSHTVTEYYKSLSKGRNLILERAKLTWHKEKKLNEAMLHFKKELRSRLKSRVNEQDLPSIDIPDPTAAFSSAIKGAITRTVGTTPTDPAASPTTPQPSAPASDEPLQNQFDTALAGGEYKAKEDDGVSGTLKRLWNALTEDGEPIGILHLVLDIVGLLGDFTGTPVGLIADLLNAVIYFYRASIAEEGKAGTFWLLGSINLISAFVFGAGDVLKGLKPGAKSAAPVMEAILKGGAKGGAEAIAKVPVKERGPAIRLLRFISKNIAGALGKASSLLGKFFGEFLAKVTGWLPFIGTPLKGAFESIGKVFNKSGESMISFSKEFGSAEKIAAKAETAAAQQAISNSLKKEGYQYVKDAADPNLVLIKNESGAVEATMSTESFKKTFGEKAAGLFGKSETDAMLLYYPKIASANPKIEESISKYMLKKGKNFVKFQAKLAFFIGKQIIKLISGGKDWQEAGFQQEEVEYWGNSAWTSWIQDEIIKKKEETGATYIPYLELDSSEKEVFERVTNYQNNYAKLFGERTLIPVVYDRYGNDGVEEEIEDLWKAIGAGTVKREEIKESLSTMKYIIPYSKF